MERKMNEEKFRRRMYQEMEIKQMKKDMKKKT